MYCLNDGEGFTMDDMGVGGRPRWTWRKGSGVPEASTLSGIFPLLTG